MFTLARKMTPCVVFVDEVDALLARRDRMEASAARREMMTEFMMEWDGYAGGAGVNG